MDTKYSSLLTVDTEKSAPLLSWIFLAWTKGGGVPGRIRTRGRVAVEQAGDDNLYRNMG